MQKQRIGSKVTVKGTALRKARRYGRVSICFWSKKNKSFGAPSTRRNRNPYTKPRRFDKSILSDLPWIFKEEFYMVEGKKNLPGEADIQRIKRYIERTRIPKRNPGSQRRGNERTSRYVGLFRCDRRCRCSYPLFLLRASYVLPRRKGGVQAWEG